MPDLSIVIPAYNEESNIKNNVLDGVFSYLKKSSFTWEVLFVDDGSTDSTRTYLRSIAAKYPNISLIENLHQGKAGTVTSGVLKSQGNSILFTDFDQATPLSEVENLLPFLKTNDIVIGSRSSRRKGAPLSRIIMARGFMLLRTVILGIKVDDTQCGFKLFRKDVAHDLFKKVVLYENQASGSGSRVTAGFDVELLFLANKLHYSIKEIPVKWRYVETRRVNPIRDSIDGLLDLIRIKLLDIQGLYD